MKLPKHHLELVPDRALIVKTKGLRILVVADIHLGKAAVFRANGMPVPEGDTQRDLERIGSLAKTYSPDQVVIAGDLFHAQSGQTRETIAAVEKFVAEIGIEVLLVEGNHDAKIRDLPKALRSVKKLELPGICIVHKPDEADPELLSICGHIHPVLRIPDGKKKYLRMPCFHLSRNVLTLPSFGSFTGGYILPPKDKDRYFVEHLGKVIEIPKELVR